VESALQQQLIDHLESFVSAHKKERIDSVLAHRTRYLTVVVENLFQPHNTSAVLRSCECFGIQDLHVIERDNTFAINDGVAVGSGKWVDIHRSGETGPGATNACLSSLRRSGYRVAALTLRELSVPLADVPLDAPLALCFGTEEEGLSDDAHAAADYFVRIPMVGFTQSLNISVTAALTLYELGIRLRASDAQWQLPKKEQDVLRLAWYRSIVPRAEMHVKRVTEAWKGG